MTYFDLNKLNLVQIYRKRPNPNWNGIYCLATLTTP